MAHISQAAGFPGSGSGRNVFWGGRMPRGSVKSRQTREEAKLRRGVGVMFDEEAYAIFHENMQRHDLGSAMRVRSGSHIVVRDQALARKLDSQTGVGMPLHFRLSRENEGHLAFPKDSQWRASALITTRKGVRCFKACRSQFLARANKGPALFLVWPREGETFEIEGVSYKVVSEERRHHKVTLIERVATEADDLDIFVAA